MVAGKGQLMAVAGIVMVPDSFPMPWLVLHAGHPTLNRHCWITQQWHPARSRRPRQAGAPERRHPESLIPQALTAGPSPHDHFRVPGRGENVLGSAVRRF
jgi:hypothetical protein